jgi:CheY-like chemotaxis protein
LKDKGSIGQATYDDFVGYLRSALHYLYDPVSLRRSSLVDLLGLSQEFDKAAALQRCLTDAIQALKPGVHEPPQSSAWRIYDTLSLQYIRQFPRSTVANQLGISDRQLRREQRLALEALAQRLWEKMDRAALSAPEKMEQPPAQLEEDQALSQELDRLKDAPMEQRIPLGEILETAVSLVQSLAEKTGVDLVVEIAAEVAATLVIHQAIRHILLTILSEMIPMAEGGRVTLSAFRQDPDIAVQVVSASGTETAQAGSKGDQGMETARRMAVFYGASLTTAFEGPYFQVTLSFLAPVQIPILVIDDNADWLDMLARFAAGSNYRVIGSRSPEKTVSLAKQIQPAVIFLDVMMPGMDGWQILNDLRSDQATHTIPIVVCTVLPLRDLALSLGVNAFLQKPVRQDQFLHVLEELVISSGWSSSAGWSPASSNGLA